MPLPPSTPATARPGPAPTGAWHQAHGPGSESFPGSEQVAAPERVETVERVAGPERKRGERTDSIGVGPWVGPWPGDPRFDPELLRDGDRRNVVDRYRYWTVEAIRADLDARRHPLHIAVENWEHDLNIGSVVRTANAFNVAAVHVVGRRRWNRRGAMVTDRYLHVVHHPDVETLVAWASDRPRSDGGAGLPLLGVDNLPGAVPLETHPLPRECVLLFGQEGPGLSEAARAHSAAVLSIAQFGSTRSINAGAAAAIAMHSWIRQHAVPTHRPEPDPGHLSS